MTERLTDRFGRPVGQIEERRDGTFVGRDNHGRLRGTYDPKRGETRDEAGRLVGTGNLLAGLIAS